MRFDLTIRRFGSKVTVPHPDAVGYDPTDTRPRARYIVVVVVVVNE